MNKIATYLNQHLIGNVYDKASVLNAYATDRSILKITPRFVVTPENTEDIRKTVYFANQLALRNYRLPVAVRGSGLDQTGADLTSGLVISTERLNEIKEINPRDRLVHVQAGVTLSELNAALSLHGLFLPVNANPKETIGGLISNCPTDSYAAKYGGIMSYVERAEIVLGSDAVVQTSRLGKRALAKKKALTTKEGNFYRDLSDLLLNHKETIDSLRTSSDSYGYPAISYISRNHDRTFDILPLFYAAQGTLGVISEVILRCEPLPRAITHFLASFSSFRSAQDFLNFAVTLSPLEANIYDKRIFKAAAEHGKKTPLVSGKLSEGFVVVLKFSDSEKKSRKKILRCINKLPKTTTYSTENPDNAEDFLGLDNILSSFLNDDIRGECASLVHDFYIPTGELQAFIRELEHPLYGSYSANNFSIRPDLRINTVEGRQQALRLLHYLGDSIASHKGSITGGYPEGRVTALVTNSLLSEEKKVLYLKLKSIADPNNILAPDIKFNADARATIRHLRVGLREGIVD